MHLFKPFTDLPAAPYTLMAIEGHPSDVMRVQGLLDAHKYVSTKSVEEGDAPGTVVVFYDVRNEEVRQFEGDYERAVVEE